MTDFEIEQSFRYALNKSKQIIILSELNDCTTDHIIKILEKSGWKCDVENNWTYQPKVKQPTTQIHKHKPITVKEEKPIMKLTKEELQKMYIDNNMSAKEISIKTKIPVDNIRNQLRTNNISRKPKTSININIKDDHVSNKILGPYANSILKEYDNQIAKAQAEVDALKEARAQFMKTMK